MGQSAFDFASSPAIKSNVSFSAEEPKEFKKGGSRRVVSKRKSILREQIAKYKEDGLSLSIAKGKVHAWHAKRHPFGDAKYRTRKSTDLAREREYKRKLKKDPH